MDLQKRIIAAKSNKYELNNIINDYKPFIANTVHKSTGKYIEYGNDDELSIGLMAFEEAIKAYNEDKGPFLSFAENVIKRRLIDYFRKESKHDNIIPLSIYDEDEENEVDMTVNKSISDARQLDENELRKLEILEIQKELKNWDISFFELPDLSPKHESTKKTYQNIIEKIILNPEILSIMNTKRYFPINKIEEITGVNRKVIERSRKYVIALVIILTGDYTYVQSYISWR